MLPTKIILNSKNKQSQTINNKTIHPLHPPNMYFYLKEQIFPIVKQNLIQYQITSSWLNSQQKVIIITQNLNVDKFQKIIQFFNGCDLEIHNMKELDEYLNIFDYMKAKICIEQIERFIQQDIQSYEVFCLLEIAYNYGMQKIFDLCLKYLEFDQFQQIKYYKYDLLGCNFKLFQIVLRRHHILKMKGQMEGLKNQDIEQVIKMYCNRHRIDQQTEDRLMKKYVQNQQNFQKIKTSLRLQKLLHKNILQSANIDTDFYQHELFHFQQLKQNTQNQLSPHRNRKQSTQVNKKIIKNIMKFSKNKDNYTQKQQADAQSILQDQNQEDQTYQINVNNILDENNQYNNSYQQNTQKQYKNYEQPDSMVSKISGIINQYNQALHQHDKKYNMRRNSQSTFFQSFRGGTVDSQYLQPRFKIMSSFNLQTKGLFPIQQPIYKNDKLSK